MVEAKNNIVQKIMNILLDIFIFIFGIILLVSIYNGIQVKLMGKSYSDFFGFSTFEVQTNSMAKTINAGDWIIVKKNQNPELNDIITYEEKGEFITHRVIEAYKGTYVTQGDANNTKDEPISSDKIVGRVVKILPHFGIVKKTLFNPAVLIALIITVYVIGYVFKKNKKESISSAYNANNSNIKNKIDIVLEKVLKKLKIFITNVKKEMNKSKTSKPIKKVSKVTPEPTLQSLIDNSKEVVKEPIKEEVKAEIKEPIKEEVKAEIKDEVKSVSIENYDNNINTEELKNDMEEVNKEITSEDDLDKTICFRSISVDKSELDHSYLNVTPEEEPTPTAPIEEEEEEDKDDNSLIKNKLEMLQAKKKRCKNIIEKIMYIKTEELNEIINVLNNDDKFKPNEATIKDMYIQNYIDGKYYNYCGNINVEYSARNMTYKMDEVIDETANVLSKSYKGSDTKYDEKVKKFQNMFILIMYLEQGFIALPDIDSKRELYKKKIIKCFRTEIINELNIKKIINEILKIQKLYKNVTNYALEQLESNTFILKTNQLTGKRNIYGLELEHNIEFSKIYSDYIVDKTYDEGVIAEDKIMVLANLLLSKIARNMLDASFKDKYILSIPNSMYEKESKLGRLFKLIEDEYAKNNIIILIQYSVLIKNKKLIKGLRKLGYKFAISFDTTDIIKPKDQGILYVSDYLFIDKKTYKNTSIATYIPEDLRDSIITEDIRSKVETFGGE